MASFSILVSNLDFRVPRLRQRGERAADRAVQRRKRGRTRGPESRPGLPRRSRLARSGPGAARAWIQVSARERGIPLLDGVFPARTGNPNRRHRLRRAPDLGLRHGSMTIETARRASLEFVCAFGQDGQTHHGRAESTGSRVRGPLGQVFQRRWLLRARRSGQVEDVSGMVRCNFARAFASRYALLMPGITKLAEALQATMAPQACGHSPLTEQPPRLAPLPPTRLCRRGKGRESDSFRRRRSLGARR